MLLIFRGMAPARPLLQRILGWEERCVGVGSEMTEVWGTQDGEALGFAVRCDLWFLSLELPSGLGDRVGGGESRGSVHSLVLS